jgi:hypothetical protein
LAEAQKLANDFAVEMVHRQLVSMPRLGGLRHRYAWPAAA